MKNILDNPKWGTLMVALTLASLTLIKIFPFYLGGLSIKLLSTHVLAKIILILPFMFALLRTFSTPESKRKPLDIAFIVAFVLYVSAQTLSVMTAIDIEAYMRQLQNVFFHYVLFYVGYTVFAEKRYQDVFFMYLLVMGGICIVVDSLFLFVGRSFLGSLQNSIQTEMVALFVHNARMGRFNSYMVLDSFIPIFFLYYHLSAKKRRQTVLLIVTLGITLLFSYLSLFRTRLIQGVFAILVSFFIYFKRRRRFIVLVLLIPTVLLSIYTATKLISPSSTTVIVATIAAGSAWFSDD